MLYTPSFDYTNVSRYRYLIMNSSPEWACLRYRPVKCSKQNHNIKNILVLDLFMNGFNLNIVPSSYERIVGNWTFSSFPLWYMFHFKKNPNLPEIICNSPHIFTSWMLMSSDSDWKIDTHYSRVFPFWKRRSETDLVKKNQTMTVWAGPLLGVTWLFGVNAAKEIHFPTLGELHWL